MGALAVISGLSTAVPETVPSDGIASVEPIVDLHEGRASERGRLGWSVICWWFDLPEQERMLQSYWSKARAFQNPEALDQ